MSIVPGNLAPAPQPSGLITINELASYLGVKVKTVYAKVEAAEIPHYRLGRLIRFRLDEIDAWLKSCRKDVSTTSILVRCKNKKSLSNGHVSALVAKTIDKVHSRNYPTYQGKSGRIEDLEKEVPEDGII